MTNLPKILFINGLCLLSFNGLSHSGNVIQSGDKRGCHRLKANNVYHCHPERIKNTTPRTSKKKNSQGLYRRKLYPHWIDRDGDCQNERQELLIGRSLVPVIFKVNRKGKSCTVSSGTWSDFYYREVLTEASEVDVDHVVPLKYAHELGAKNWSRERRRQFANDHENLVLTNKKYNRQKGAKSPLEWLPIEKEYACKYFKQWFKVKMKYNLKISSREKSEFKSMECQVESV